MVWCILVWYDVLQKLITCIIVSVEYGEEGVSNKAGNKRDYHVTQPFLFVNLIILYRLLNFYHAIYRVMPLFHMGCPGWLDSDV